MKPSTGKPSKKTMRVATIFTGIAASTLAVGQQANAQDVVHPVTTHTPKQVGRTMRPAYRESGSIRHAYSCYNAYGGANVDKTWVHIWTEVFNVSYQESLVTDCYGYKGTSLSPRGHGVIAVCGGENHGYLTGDNNGQYWVYDFKAGTKTIALSKTSLYDVTITGWSGADQCI
jgi:hypothetical protein